ncbi:MAG: flagellar export protein FliJ [Opitutae bacterium]|nr:flagellar export protein FliJ [Opitutae bacterium]
MKAFTFRLESLLHLRSLTRERRLKEYAQSIEVRRSADRRCGELEDQLKEIEAKVAAGREQTISGHDQAIFLASIDHSKAAISKQREIALKATTEEESKRASYIESDIAEKTLLRLKERLQEEHLREQLYQEDRALEDVIGSRHGVILPTEFSYENT